MIRTSGFAGPPLLALFLSGTPLFAQDAPKAPPEQGLTELLQDCRTVALAPGGFALRQRSASVHRLRLDLDEGTLIPLIGQSGDRLGFYFQGKGFYFYQSEDPADRQILARNLARFAVAPRFQEGRASDPFDRAVILFGPGLLPEWSGMLAGMVAGAERSSRDPDFAEGFREMWGPMVSGPVPWDHRIAEATLNGRAGAYLYAEFNGKSRRAGYLYDGIKDGEESYFFFERGAPSDPRQRNRLSVQSVGEAGHQASPSLVLKDAQIRIATEDNRIATIASDLTLQSTARDLRIARLDLLNNRADFAAAWDTQRNQLRLRRVADETGRALRFSHRYHEVIVELARPAGEGQFVNLRFDTEGEVLTGLWGETYQAYFDLFLGPWFPNPMVWGESGYTFDLKVRTRKPYRPVASGATRALREDGDFYELDAESPRPMRGIAVFAGKYATSEQKIEDLTLRVNAMTARKDVLEKMPPVAFKFLKFFAGVLGPYEFEDLDIVEIPGSAEEGGDRYGAFGIAPPGMVLLTSEAYNARRNLLTEHFSRGINARLAHEIAHQWFGHKAIPASSRDTWISESAAEYLSGLAMAATQPDEAQVTGFPQMMIEWQAGAKLCENSPIERANSLTGDSGFMERYCLLYQRGPLVLHMLHTMVGHDRFYAILRHFLDHAHHGLASIEDFQSSAREILQTDMNWFFRQWFQEPGTPEVRVEHTLQEKGGAVTLVARASQAPDRPFKKLLIPLVVEYPDGKREAKLLFQETAFAEARFELSGKPRRVSVDPAHNNLAVYR